MSKYTMWDPNIGNVSLSLAMDATGVGQTTATPVNATTIAASGATVLTGVVSGAGFTAAVQAIAGAGQTLVQKSVILAALPLDTTSISAAATPANGAITLAAQPVHARKLNYNIHIGTSPTTAITAGTLTTVGFDQDGNAISEVISLVTTTSKAIASAHAWSSVTSSTIAAYAASGSGTGNTLGVGVTNDFGISTGQGTVSNFACVKATKNTRVVTGSGTEVTVWTNTAADDVASTTTVDAVARTIAPTTAPAANGLVDFEFTYLFNLAA